jgi:protein-disulfide isomerase
MRFLLVFCCAFVCFSASAKETPYVDLTGIEGERRQLFDDITTERLSPCGDPETLADAFTKEKPCLLAVSYARILARLLRSGFSRDHIDKFMNRVEENSKKSLAQINVEDRPARGPEKAPVVIIEFADYECPYCGRLEPVLQKVLQKHSSIVKHYFLNFPLTTLHPMADAAARAALAAKKQGKFWEMHDLLYERQEKLNPDKFADWAKELGLDVDQFQRDLTSPDVATELSTDLDQAMNSLHLDGTPTLFFNGRRYIEANTEEALENALLLAYAEATGDTAPFLIDPGTEVRIKTRAEQSSFFFLLVGIAQCLLVALFLGISILRAKRAKTQPLAVVVPVSIICALLGLVAYITLDESLTQRYGPGDSWLTSWILASVASSLIAAALGFVLKMRLEATN